MNLHVVSLLAPLAMLVAAAAGFLEPGRRPRLAARVAEPAALGALVAAAISALVVATQGSGEVRIFGVATLLDGLTAVMLLLVAFVGWVVPRYARTYMDGERREGAFTGWLALTLAAVLTLVQAGHLALFAVAFVATSAFLHRLLLFRPDRPAAKRAARKKFVTACLADAALLKSAQFPTHGWLTEVMETPTPVSALLHAGVINAGGFLLIRFADVMLLSPGVLAVLVMFGGFTALFAGVVMLTQP